MKYKIKHIPTGLYFQPYKARKSSLSKNGKIYQTESNCLNTNTMFGGMFIYCHNNSIIHKSTKHLDWEKVENSVYNNKLKLFTDYSKWEIENV